VQKRAQGQVATKRVVSAQKKSERKWREEKKNIQIKAEVQEGDVKHRIRISAY